MGTDISLFVERREPGRPWRPALVTQRCLCRREDGCSICGGEGFRRGFHVRDYAVFGLLAGVRGGDSALGNPRGLPVDLSPELRLVYEDQLRGVAVDDDEVLRRQTLYGGAWFGDRSYSHATLAELLAIPLPPASRYATELIPQLQRLGAHGDVRIVFGFDF